MAEELHCAHNADMGFRPSAVTDEAHAPSTSPTSPPDPIVQLCNITKCNGHLPFAASEGEVTRFC